MFTFAIRPHFKNLDRTGNQYKNRIVFGYENISCRSI